MLLTVAMLLPGLMPQLLTRAQSYTNINPLYPDFQAQLNWNEEI